ncbi:hypothetical protein C4552_00880 [Candidatus Parcubacteria bacterium]|nr:MAG: hypothetical protein C4552_00880 [Candidatus Parcubacteria bacterium]
MYRAEEYMDDALLAEFMDNVNKRFGALAQIMGLELTRISGTSAHARSDAAHMIFHQRARLEDLTREGEALERRAKSRAGAAAAARPPAGITD